MAVHMHIASDISTMGGYFRGKKNQDNSFCVLVVITINGHSHSIRIEICGSKWKGNDMVIFV